MKLSKDLKAALEAVSKEVDNWPSWKRSIDLNDLTQQAETSRKSEVSEEQQTNNRKPRPLTRAAGA